MIYLLAAFLTLVIIGLFHEWFFGFLHDLYSLLLDTFLGEDEE